MHAVDVDATESDGSTNTCVHRPQVPVSEGFRSGGPSLATAKVCDDLSSWRSGR